MIHKMEKMAEKTIIVAVATMAAAAQRLMASAIYSLNSGAEK